MDTETETTVDQEQGPVGEGQVEGVAPDGTEAVPTPEVELRHETWPHDDVRKLVRAAEMTNTRGVNIMLLCRGCEQPLAMVGRDGGGASLMRCGCAVRRWL